MINNGALEALILALVILFVACVIEYKEYAKAKKHNIDVELFPFYPSKNQIVSMILRSVDNEDLKEVFQIIKHRLDNYIPESLIINDGFIAKINRYERSYTPIFLPHPYKRKFHNALKAAFDQRLIIENDRAFCEKVLIFSLDENITPKTLIVELLQY